MEKILAEQAIDVILMDGNLCAEELAVDVVKSLRATGLTAKIIMFSSDEKLNLAGIDAGADDSCNKKERAGGEIFLLCYRCSEVGFRAIRSANLLAPSIKIAEGLQFCRRKFFKLKYLPNNGLQISEKGEMKMVYAVVSRKKLSEKEKSRYLR